MSDAILYARYSPRPVKKNASGDTVEPESIENQLERMERYCQMAELNHRGHVLCEPATSGAKPLRDRPEGRMLLKYIAEGIKHVVVQRLDRLFRNAPEAMVQLDEWTNIGVALHLADQGGNSINTATAIGWFMAGQIALTADFERRLGNERTSQAMRRYQRGGRRMSSECPYGMMPDPAEAGKMVECPEEQETIRKIVELRVVLGYSYADIVRKLNSNSVPARGERWHHQTVKRILEGAEF